MTPPRPPDRPEILLNHRCGGKGDVMDDFKEFLATRMQRTRREIAECDGLAAFYARRAEALRRELSEAEKTWSDKQATS